MRKLLLSVVPSCLWVACAHAPPKDAGHDHGHHGQGMHHRFDDPAQWAPIFEDPARDGWQKPDEVIAALMLRPDAKVADLGAATGYFSVRLARAVPRGRVYGVDVEPKMVTYLDQRAAAEKLENLKGVLADQDDAKLPDVVDLVLVVDTYHHLQDRPAYLKRLVPWLSSKGRVVVIDFTRNSSMGPPPEHRLTPEQVRAEFESAGFSFLKAHQILPEQYFLEFVRP
jgi:cyclopropane fatty-acyl-phospholipid synthase-like methyltransferase